MWVQLELAVCSRWACGGACCFHGVDNRATSPQIGGLRRGKEGLHASVLKWTWVTSIPVVTAGQSARVKSHSRILIFISFLSLYYLFLSLPWSTHLIWSVGGAHVAVLRRYSQLSAQGLELRVFLNAVLGLESRVPECKLCVLVLGLPPALKSFWSDQR